jgi:hypothetical protein
MVRREKSVRYPYYNLEDSLGFAKMIDQIAGRKDAPISAILEHMGIKSENNKQLNYKISSSEQFGLISKHNKSLVVTELARNILSPPGDESQKQQLLLEAFQSPPIYKQLIEKYEEKELPVVLPNVLQNMGIVKSKIDRAAKVFKQSARYANALDEESKLQTLNIENKRLETSETPLDSTKTKQTQIESISQGCHNLNLSLSNGQILKLSIPVNISKQEVEKIKKMLDVLVIE